jgi:hypothetical protein
MTKD